MRSLLLALLVLAPAFDENPVDVRLAELWKQHGIEPASICDDAEFLRRATLDLAGTIPTADEARAFIESKAPDKRTAKIDALLASDAFLDFWSLRLTAALIGFPRDYEYVVNREGLRLWLRGRLAEGADWGAIASDLIQARGAIKDAPEGSFISQFLQFGVEGQGLKIEELTGRATSVFLGTRLRCAQCHDHPHDGWTQEDFFGMVAYFQKTDVGGEYNAVEVRTQRRPVRRKIEGLTGELKPRFIGLGEPESENLRLEFAEQMVKHERFARACVNRIWACLFGRGIVNPYDDFAPQYKPVAPALLDDLAARFRERKHDIRWLIRTIMTSQAWQRSSRASQGQDAAQQEKLFARARVRPLTPDQLWNALDRATGLSAADVDLKAVRRMVGKDPASMEASGRVMLRRWFMNLMVRTSNPDAPAALGTYTANVQQILRALNIDSPLWSGIRPLGSGVLDELLLVSDDPDIVIERLYLWTLGRKPTESEARLCRDHVDSRREGGAAKAKEAGLEEVFWALLNTDEFIFNH